MTVRRELRPARQDQVSHNILSCCGEKKSVLDKSSHGFYGIKIVLDLKAKILGLPDFSEMDLVSVRVPKPPQGLQDGMGERPEELI